ncbi:MAG: hypothetical protein GXO93_00065, partial [FCB group bacterium]|nr:hypothetical protein [FCB group bacterium]
SILPIALLLLLIVPDLWGRAAMNAQDKMKFQSKATDFTPKYEIVSHHIGNIVLAINNNGTFGTGFAAGVLIDHFTGETVPSCEFPKNSHIRYLFAGAFWVGAVVGRDTLVSVAADGWSFTKEFNPGPNDTIIKRSITHPNAPGYDKAISEEDYIMKYNDTITQDIEPDYFGRPHIPLNIEVTQRSFAWSYPYAKDFVLFDYSIKNIGINKLKNVYMGIYVDGDVYFEGGANQNSGYNDDICGFIETIPADFKGCQYIDTVNIAWIADNDGDPVAQTTFNEQSPTGVTGTRIIRTPADTLDVSFNWWISNTPSLDFGPREQGGKGRWKEPFRDFGTGGLGTPEGDVNKYYMMRNMEFDYDQVYTASILPTDTLWMLPPQDRAGDYADGFDTRYLLSFGPFNINPGENLPISFSYVGGEHFHINPHNLDNLPNNPDKYYQNIDFSSLATNSSWSAKIYDNPGVDTDSDGYAGEFFVCVFDSNIRYVHDTIDGKDTVITVVDTTLSDTLWTEGDGVPDFRGASPPPAPDFWLEPSQGAIRVRFNGFRSETTKDAFSHIEDFEGYRIYIARDERASSFTMLASYDIEDYNKYIWNNYKKPQPGFDLLNTPFTIDSLRCLYGDSCNDTYFNPLQYTRSSPYVHPLFPDSVFYFEPQDFNASELGVSTPIRKIYPNQPYPSSFNPDSVQPNELTEDGYLKYFEYEFDITNLMPTVPYWVNITAFDFGSPESGLRSLESSKSNGAKEVYASNPAKDVIAKNLKAFVYPNPYRYDANYYNLGYEGREDIQNSNKSPDRLRAIHFANLPPKCTIKIFSLDGDLIREIQHDKDPSDPTATEDQWDLITRNTQMTVSGLYYWTVEADNMETQIGKLVIIM